MKAFWILLFSVMLAFGTLSTGARADDAPEAAGDSALQLASDADTLMTALQPDRTQLQGQLDVLGPPPAGQFLRRCGRRLAASLVPGMALRLRRIAGAAGVGVQLALAG
ncbi:hypothetical protein [Sodalis glossinidius]